MITQIKNLNGVLNLVINGIPSIQNGYKYINSNTWSFKPCYKWNTFNTYENGKNARRSCSFKPCYKWNTFNTNENDREYEE